MAEQSHLEAMREAIKGDLERARSRNPSIFERPAAPPPVEIQETPPPEPEPVVAATSEPEPEPVVEPEAAAEPEPEHEVEPTPEPGPRRSFLSRLAFWRR